MDNYAILCMKKYHDLVTLNRLQQHHNREIPLPHVKYEDTIKNVTLIDAGSSYVNAWKNRMQKAEIERGTPIPVRKNSVKFFELVLSYSPDADINIKEWYKLNVEWLKEKFGESNILSCVLHLDEETPHIHVDVIPITKDNRLCMKDFIDGPMDLKKLQTEYGNVMKKCGLKRGEKNTKSKKTTLDRFYRAINKIENNPFPTQQENESESEYITRLQEYTTDLKYAYENMKQKAKRTDEIIKTRVNNHYVDAIDTFHLQYQIEKNLKEKEQIKKRLKTYQKIEEVVPQNELEKVLHFLLDRYQKEEVISSQQQITHAFEDKTQ